MRQISETDQDQTSPRLDHGLRSLRGIRWLLLAGSLLTGVSVYHLLERQWADFPSPVQFLLLTAGALVVFGAGDLTRHRLRLPQVGAGLLVLFLGLVPVLAVGSAWLGLLRSGPAGLVGWAAVGLAVAALAAASGRVARRLAGYEGWLFPALVAALALATPVLELLGRSLGTGSGGSFGYLAATGVLGALLHEGCRHLYRHLFHRDRRDGIERPIVFAPFLTLGGLYAAAVVSFQISSAGMAPGVRIGLLALPVAVFGAVLVLTAGELHRAVAEAEGRLPTRWPRRALALLAVGFALLAGALPLAFLDPSLRSVPLVGACIALVLLPWGQRTDSAVAWGAGLAGALTAWHFLPALWAGPLRLAGAVARMAAGPGADGLLTSAFLHVPSFLALLAFGTMGGAGRRVRRTHAVAVLIAGLTLPVLAFAHPAGALWTGLFVVAALLASGLAAGRPEQVAGAQLALAVTAMAAAVLLGAGESLREALWVAPVICLVGVAGQEPLEKALRRRLADESWWRAEDATHRLGTLLLAPSLLVGFAVLVLGAAGVSGLEPMGAVEVAFAGGLLLAAGRRARSAKLMAFGAASASLGLHAALLLGGMLQGADAVHGAALLTMLMLGLTGAGQILMRKGGEPVREAWRGVLLMSLVLHAWLGIAWYAASLFLGVVTLEPLILLFFGLPAGVEGMRRSSRSLLLMGVVGLMMYLPLQAHGLGILTHPAELVLAAGLSLLAILAASRLAARRRPGLFEGVEAVFPAVAMAWTAAGLVTCLIFAGPPILLLAVLLPLVVLLAEGPDRSRGLVPDREWVDMALAFGLPLVLHLSLAAGACLEEGIAMLAERRVTWMAVELASRLPAALPLGMAAFALWRVAAGVAADRSDRGSAKALTTLALVAELALVPVTLWTLAFWMLSDGSPAFWQECLVVGTAAGLALRHAWASLQRLGLSYGPAWWAHLWAVAAGLEAMALGWIPLETGLLPAALVAGGAAEYGLGRLLERRGAEAHALARSCRVFGRLLVAGGAMVGFVRAFFAADAVALWKAALPIFLASAFHLLAAWRGGRRRLDAPASAVSLGAALLAVLHGAVRWDLAGPELYCLAPGGCLLALAGLLSSEMGPVWSRRLFTAGAALIYATPVAGLWQEMTWAGQAWLLAASIVFGAASFHLRSRSLLVVSTAALVVDLGFFTVLVGRTEPMLLWLAGLLVGAGLLALAGWLEYRREGLLQQIRVFGSEIRSWY